MQRLRLSEMEERVYQAVAGLQARGETPYSSAIVRQARLDEEQVRETLRGLTEKNLLHREESGLDGVDYGPRWCVSQPT